MSDLIIRLTVLAFVEVLTLGLLFVLYRSVIKQNLSLKERIHILEKDQFRVENVLSRLCRTVEAGASKA
jgi:hypothetical protein